MKNLMNKRGTLNVSKFQTKPNQPRFYGRASLNGVMYELKGWEKTSPSGEPWISILFEEAGEEFESAKATPATQSSMFSQGTITPVRRPITATPHILDDDDDNPF